MKFKLEDVKVKSFITKPAEIKGGFDTDNCNPQPTNGYVYCNDETENIIQCTGTP